ncbi:MAG TPA: ABC transporter substrate-binding protein [Dehalococcoidia bacterium]|nr:ABC transporter substrate-binding protein [Dehalococcoidia bacterium]
MPAVKIGALMDLTGPLSGAGQWVKTGIEFRMEEAGYEVAGKKVELIIEDDASDTAKALEKAKKLVETDKVSLILGPLHAGAALAVAPYVSSAKVPNLSISGLAWDWTAKFDYTFGPSGSLRQATKAMGWYAYEALGLKNVTTIGTDFVAGYAYIGGFADGFKEKGGTIVQQQWAPTGTPDFSPYLTALKPADATVAWIVGTDVPFLKQYEQYGLYKKMPLHASTMSGFAEPVTLKEVGDSALGIQGQSYYTALIDSAENKPFVERFTKKLGRPPTALEVQAYVAASFALEALKITGGDTAPDKLSKALMGLKLNTPMGPISFDPTSRFGIRTAYIVEATKVGGEWVQKVIKAYPEFKPVPDQ